MHKVIKKTFQDPFVFITKRMGVVSLYNNKRTESMEKKT